jgi:hypothetical protein
MKLLYIPQNQLFLIFGVVAALVVALYILYVRASNQKHKANQIQTETLRQQYLQTIKAGDKPAALQAGRNYYSSLRGGRLTIYDEQALANDLAAMK